MALAQQGNSIRQCAVALLAAALEQTGAAAVAAVLLWGWCLDNRRWRCCSLKARGGVCGLCGGVLHRRRHVNVVVSLCWMAVYGCFGHGVGHLGRSCVSMLANPRCCCVFLPDHIRNAKSVECQELGML